MVKGTTKQVLVVSGANSPLFEQAIFLVREEALRGGGVTEDALLREANQVCRQSPGPHSFRDRLLWISLGSAITGLIWVITTLI